MVIIQIRFGLGELIRNHFKQNIPTYQNVFTSNKRYKMIPIS